MALIPVPFGKKVKLTKAGVQYCINYHKRLFTEPAVFAPNPYSADKGSFILKFKDGTDTGWCTNQSLIYFTIEKPTIIVISKRK